VAGSGLGENESLRAARRCSRWLAVCGRCRVVVVVVAVGLREDWEEDSGGCRCVRPEEERSRCGAVGWRSWVCRLWVEAVVVCCEGGEAEVED
jgi:hypothetical protein